VSSYRFLFEATNTIWDSFLMEHFLKVLPLNEATGGVPYYAFFFLFKYLLPAKIVPAVLIIKFISKLQEARPDPFDPLIY